MSESALESPQRPVRVRGGQQSDFSMSGRSGQGAGQAQLCLVSHGPSVAQAHGSHGDREVA